MTSREIGKIIIVTDFPEAWKVHLAVQERRGSQYYNVVGASYNPYVKMTEMLPTGFDNFTLRQYRLCGTPEATIAAVANAAPRETRVDFLSVRKFDEDGLPAWQATSYGERRPSEMVIIDRPFCNRDFESVNHDRMYVLVDSQNTTEPSQVNERWVGQIMCHPYDLTPPKFLDVEEGDGQWLVYYKLIERLAATILLLREHISRDPQDSRYMQAMVDDVELALKRQFPADEESAFGTPVPVVARMRLSLERKNMTVHRERFIEEQLARLEPFIAAAVEANTQAETFSSELAVLNGQRLDLVHLASSVSGLSGAFAADLRRRLEEIHTTGPINRAMRALKAQHEWLVANRAHVAQGRDAYFLDLYDRYTTCVGKFA